VFSDTVVDALCSSPSELEAVAGTVVELELSAEDEGGAERNVDEDVTIDETFGDISQPETPLSVSTISEATPPVASALSSASKGYAQSVSVEKLLFGAISCDAEDDDADGVDPKASGSLDRIRLLSRRSDPMLCGGSVDSQERKEQTRRSLTSFDDITGVSLGGVFSPQEVKKRSSIKKEHRAISLISKQKSGEGLHSHFRPRSQSDESISSAGARRSSTHARIEGNAKALDNFYLTKQSSFQDNPPVSSPTLAAHFAQFDASTGSPQRSTPVGKRTTRASISMGYFSRYNSSAPA
jgi:hypothetical protein